MIKPAARALNKPMLIVGVDRKLAGLAFILSVIVGANGSRLIAAILFVLLCAVGRRLSRRDPNIFMVFRQTLKRKTSYDPIKRTWFRAVFEKRAE